MFARVAYFKCEKDDLKDLPQSGSHQIAVTVENVRRKLECDERSTIYQISEDVGIRYGSVRTILHEHLGLSKLSALERVAYRAGGGPNQVSDAKVGWENNRHGLAALRFNINNRRRGCLSEGLFLLHDNAPYEKTLKRKRFQSDAGVIAAAQDFLSNQPTDFFLKGDYDVARKGD
ncbi:unnamed protein product [Orchesella dallaii]|uniref:Uncharacterized protein n=1 Tax=Orchesella dallaii TaxID=48710 RepID=A0ABP1S6L1_9HEXA